jgi:hypothetical protein
MDQVIKFWEACDMVEKQKLAESTNAAAGVMPGGPGMAPPAPPMAPGAPMPPPQMLPGAPPGAPMQ